MIEKIKRNIVLSLFVVAGTSATTASADTIVVFGASGDVGTVIVLEALSRGHIVLGVSRSPQNFTYTEANFSGVLGNPTDPESVKALAVGADAIINVVGGRLETDPSKTPMVLSAKAITAALSGLGDDQPHLLVIGGGTTMAPSRENLINNMPGAPKEGTVSYAAFLGHWDAYQTYKDSDIDWTFLSPPMGLLGYRRGENIKTGNYRSSTDGHVKDANGNNSISMADLAVAALDFAEKGLFNKQKVTVGY